MDLRQLRFFVAAAEHGAVRAAARAVYVAQPAVSRGIRQLERELGVELLNRSRVGVALTDAGAEFIEHARAVLRRVDDASEAMRTHAAHANALRVATSAEAPPPVEPHDPAPPPSAGGPE